MTMVHATQGPAPRFVVTQELVSRLTWVTLGALATLVIAGALWWIGSAFTIAFFRFLAGKPIDISAIMTARIYVGWYAIPVTFSAIEIAGWKVRGDLAFRIRRLASGVTGVDMSTTGYGLFVAIVGTYLPAIGIIRPVEWMVYAALVLAGLVAWWCTLAPERYIVESVGQLIENVKTIIFIVRGGSNGKATK
ncbi:MAG: hypothetical protein IPP13_21520 [Kouleothrix sp.]|jgi:energy-converting hydrogenase Eha subunit C|nr:hypothetical protein [Kouleothrix sp.]